jgi:hypothetical protein
MLTRIWISTLNMPLAMSMLALRRLLVLRVLHHLCYVFLDISLGEDRVCSSRKGFNRCGALIGVSTWSQIADRQKSGILEDVGLYGDLIDQYRL